MEKRKEIEKLAYELYKRDGCTSGREVEHWLEAERIVHSRYEVLVIEQPAGFEGAAPQAAKASAKEGKKAPKSKTAPEAKSARKSSVKGKATRAGAPRKKSSM